MEERNEIVRWYAVKVFFNRMNPLREQLILDGVNFFVPDAIKSLLFIQVSDSYLSSFEKSNFGRVWIYRDLLTGKPSAIPDRSSDAPTITSRKSCSAPNPSGLMTILGAVLSSR